MDFDALPRSLDSSMKLHWMVLQLNPNLVKLLGEQFYTIGSKPFEFCRRKMDTGGKNSRICPTIEPSSLLGSLKGVHLKKEDDSMSEALLPSPTTAAGGVWEEESSTVEGFPWQEIGRSFGIRP